MMSWKKLVGKLHRCSTEILSHKNKKHNKDMMSCNLIFFPCITLQSDFLQS